MEIGDIVYIKRRKIYDEDKVMYQRGVIERKYRHHVLVKFEFSNGNVIKESFYEYELKKGEELEDNEYIY